MDEYIAPVSRRRRRSDATLVIYSPLGADSLQAIVLSRPVVTILPLQVKVDNLPHINMTLDDAAHKIIELQPENMTELVNLLRHPENGLAFRGHTARNRIFGNHGIEVLRLSLSDPDDVDLPQIEIITETFLIPWEYLFDEYPRNLPIEISLSGLTKPFWGMKYVVSRRRLSPTWSPNAGGALLTHRNLSHPLRVGAIIDTTLDYGEAEKAWLNSQDKTKIVTEFFPYDETWDLYQLIEQMNLFLSRADFDVIHFACHGNPVDNNSLYSSLILSDSHKYQLDYMNSPTKLTISAPLVFFNACSTGIRNPLQTFDFVRQFQDSGARNVIAIESSIYNRVATKFATYFYAQLAEHSSIGEALTISRRAVIDTGTRVSDVTALFYSLYGDPDIIAVAGDEL